MFGRIRAGAASIVPSGGRASVPPAPAEDLTRIGSPPAFCRPLRHRPSFRANLHPCARSWRSASDLSPARSVPPRMPMPLCRQGLRAGRTGLHPRRRKGPDGAMRDGAQQLHPGSSSATAARRQHLAFNSRSPLRRARLPPFTETCIEAEGRHVSTLPPWSRQGALAGFSSRRGCLPPAPPLAPRQASSAPTPAFSTSSESSPVIAACHGKRRLARCDAIAEKASWTYISDACPSAMINPPWPERLD